MVMDDDELEAGLRRLPPRDLDTFTTERVRRAAQRALREERAAATQPWRGTARRAWRGVLEPALVTGTIGVYLFWAVRAVEALYR